MAKNPSSNNGLKVGVNQIVADPIVLSELKKMGFDANHAKISIEANRNGPDFAAYYLQLKKMKR